MNERRHYTEHSPKVQAVYEELCQEWMTQYAIREGRPKRPIAKGQLIHVRNAALFCVNFDIDPARLVSTALEVGATTSYVFPSLLRSNAVLHALNATVAKDDEGVDHTKMAAREALYRAEWTKVKALESNNIPYVAMLDESYNFRPLVQWIIATKAKLDATRFYIDAVAEFRRNRPEAEKVFGDVVKGLL